MNGKLLTILVACMMLAGVGIGIVQYGDDSEAAAGAAGNMNVYVNSDGTWAGESVSAANGCEALKASSFYGDSTATVDGSYTYSYVYGGVTYTDISASYGTVTKLQNVANGADGTWNVFVYIKDADGNWSWTVGSAASGYYKPFADYANLLPNYGTANIAFWYGNNADNEKVIDAIVELENYTLAVEDLTQIDRSSGSVFEHVFYLKNTTDKSMTFTQSVTTYTPSASSAPQYTSGVSLTASILNSGVYVVGYGSDAELALIDALGDDASFYASTNPVPGYQAYGWIDKIFGRTTETVVEGSGEAQTYHYYFWSTYTTYGDSPSQREWAGYNIGAYSALTNAPLVDGTLALIYEYS